MQGPIDLGWVGRIKGLLGPRDSGDDRSRNRLDLHVHQDGNQCSS